MSTEINLYSSMDPKRSYSNGNPRYCESKSKIYEVFDVCEIGNDTAESKILKESSQEYNESEKFTDDNIIKSRTENIFYPLSSISFIRKSDYNYRKDDVGIMEKHKKVIGSVDNEAKTGNINNMSGNNISLLQSNLSHKAELTSIETFQDITLSNTNSTCSKNNLSPYDQLSQVVVKRIDSQNEPALLKKRIRKEAHHKPRENPKISLKIKKRANLKDDQSGNMRLNKLSRKKIINELYPRETFELDLNQYIQIKEHSFMKTHFPNMYTQENIYFHLKLFHDKRKTRKNIFTNNTETPVFLNNQISESKFYIKPLWKPTDCIRDGMFKLKLVEIFLKDIEKIWPSHEIIFSEELALEFFYLNHHCKENTLKKIGISHKDFLDFVDDKKRSFVTNSGFEQKSRTKKKYSLRCIKN
jgi:hypothetical protein